MLRSSGYQYTLFVTLVPEGWARLTSEFGWGKAYSLLGINLHTTRYCGICKTCTSLY